MRSPRCAGGRPSRCCWRWARRPLRGAGSGRPGRAAGRPRVAWAAWVAVGRVGGACAGHAPAWAVRAGGPAGTGGAAGRGAWAPRDAGRNGSGSDAVASLKAGWVRASGGGVLFAPWVGPPLPATGSGEPTARRAVGGTEPRAHRKRWGTASALACAPGDILGGGGAWWARSRSATRNWWKRCGGRRRRARPGLRRVACVTWWFPAHAS